MYRELEFQVAVLRNYADYGLLNPISQSRPTVRMDDSGRIKTSMTGDFMIPDFAVDFLTDELQPRMIIDGIPHNLGVFSASRVQETSRDGLDYVHIVAYDRGQIVRDHVIEQARYFPAGTNYITAIMSVLEDSGIALIYATPSAATLAEAREWPIGTSNLDIINELLAEINYEDLYFDSTGTAVLRPASIPRAAQIQHTLDAETVESMVLPEQRKEIDLYNAPNVFMCICSNADKDAPMVATAVNTNPQSPLSVVRRGRRIVQVVNVPNIADQAALQSYAFRLVSKSMLSAEQIRVQTCLLPGFGVRDVTAINIGDLFAICIERSWSMDLGVGGLMTHDLERVVLNVD